MSKNYPMTGDEVKIAFAAAGYDVHKLASLFGVSTRSIWRWEEHGAPMHVALAIEDWLSGRLKDKGIRPFLRRIGRTRSDGDRYARAKASTEASTPPLS